MAKQSTESRAAVLPGDPTSDNPFTLPYGLKPERGVLVPDEEKAKVVRRIFETAGRGRSPVDIAQTLKTEKVPPPEGATEWTAEAVETILRNRAYIGDWGGFGRVEQTLVDADLFESVQPRAAATI